MRSVFKQKHSLQLSRVACSNLSICLQDRFETQPRMLNDSLHIGDQGNTSVAHDCGSGENPHALHRRMHRLDHHFFGPVDFVHHQPKATSRQLEDQNIRDSCRSSCSWMRCKDFRLGFSSERRRSIDNVLEAYDRQQPLTQSVNLGVISLFDFSCGTGMQANDFFELSLRNCESISVNTHDQTGNDRKRQRQPEYHGTSMTNNRINRQCSFKLLDIGFDNIHADSAARNLRHLLGRREPWQQNQSKQLTRRHPLQFSFCFQA